MARLSATLFSQYFHTRYLVHLKPVHLLQGTPCVGMFHVKQVYAIMLQYLLLHICPLVISTMTASLFYFVPFFLFPFIIFTLPVLFPS